jgi:hypothetical protein
MKSVRSSGHSRIDIGNFRYRNFRKRLTRPRIDRVKRFPRPGSDPLIPDE